MSPPYTVSDVIPLGTRQLTPPPPCLPSHECHEASPHCHQPELGEARMAPVAQRGPHHMCVPLPCPCPRLVLVYLSCVPIMCSCHPCVPIPCPCLHCTSAVPSHTRVPTASPVRAMSLMSPPHTPVPIPITNLCPCCISAPVVHPCPHMTTSHDTSMSLLQVRVPIPCLCAHHMLVSLLHTQVPVASPCPRCTPTSSPHSRVPITPTPPQHLPSAARPLTPRSPERFPPPGWQR